MELISMRLSEETKEAFENLLKSFEGSRDDQVVALLNEIQSRRAGVKYPEQSEGMSAFQRGMDSLRQMYENSIELSKQAWNQVAGEYEKKLEQKDNQIKEMQARPQRAGDVIGVKDAEISRLEQINAEHEKRIRLLNNEVNELRKGNKSLAEALANNTEILETLRKLCVKSEENAEILKSKMVYGDRTGNSNRRGMYEPELFDK